LLASVCLAAGHCGNTLEHDLSNIDPNSKDAEDIHAIIESLDSLAEADFSRLKAAAHPQVQLGLDGFIAEP
jgi:hypothetical protein